jgi:tRNA(adenine34) deaminase
LTLNQKLYISSAWTMDDQFYMMLAIKEAKQAQSLGEVPVGAVIVDNKNNVIGHGYNAPVSTCDPTCHAEISAIRMAACRQNNYRLTGTTLYVTIEPCIMCMGAIIHSRINRVVFGALDPKWGAVRSLYRMAEDHRLNHHPEIVSGICEEQTRNLMKCFFKNKRSR